MYLLSCDREEKVRRTPSSKLDLPLTLDARTAQRPFNVKVCNTSYLRILRALDRAKWHCQVIPFAVVNTNRKLGRKDEMSLLLKGSGGVSG